MIQEMTELTLFSSSLPPRRRSSELTCRNSTLENRQCRLKPEWAPLPEGHKFSPNFSATYFTRHWAMDNAQF